MTLSGLERRTVPTSGTDVAVWEIGEGRPLMALAGMPVAHGGVAAPLERALAGTSGWRRIYLDIPGIGETPRGSVTPSADALLKTVIEVADVLLGSDPFVALGQSYGGYLALGLAAEMPDRIQGLGLVVPVIEPVFANRVLPPVVKLIVDDSAVARLDPSFLEEMRPVLVIETPEVINRIAADLAPAVMSFDEEFVTELQSNAYSFKTRDLPSSVPVPTLLVCGRHDSVVGYRQAVDLVSGFERATIAVVDGAGHALELERPGVYSTLVVDWLDRCAHDWAD